MRRSTASVLLLAATIAGAFAAAPTAAAVTLPPALVAALEADRREADATLRAARARLAKAAQAQRVAAAHAARLGAMADVLRGAAGVVDARMPAGIAAEVAALERRVEQELQERDAALEHATEVASSAQAASLDADRRIRALQRASRTEDERDTTLGSWRFGSGGPPVSAESLDRYLESKGSPLAGQGAAFLEAGVEHEVDPRLVVAIAGAESYFGIITCAPHNAWGWGCPNGPFRFDTWAHGIDTVTLGLREGYIDDGLTSVGEIHLRYAPPDAANDPTDLNYAWADNVARFLVEQGGDPQDVAGVLGPSR